MRKELLEILRCPSCKSTDLRLETATEDDIEITEGAIVCSQCSHVWSVSGGIVDMMDGLPEVTRREVEGRVRFVKDTTRTMSMTDEWLLGLPETALHMPSEKGRDYVNNLLELSDLAGFGPKARVLDIGAGNCWGSWRIAARGASVVAVDVSRVKYDGLESGAVQIGGHGHYFERVLGDMENLPFDDESVDGCLFFATLHHSHNLNLAFSEAARVLRPGGAALAVHEGVSGILRNNKVFAPRGAHNVEWQDYDWNEQVFSLHTYLRAARCAGLAPQLVLPPFVEHRLERREFEGLLFRRIAALGARTWHLPGGRTLLRSKASIFAASYLVGMPLTAVFWKAAPARARTASADERRTDSDRVAVACHKK
jgi:SAM-dependent methyltransferase/uncharacterized protein YbaR (Trm112 family)